MKSWLHPFLQCSKVVCAAGSRGIATSPGCLTSSSSSINADTESSSIGTADVDAKIDVAMVSRPHPCIDKALRVNYAGELAAARMCAGRMSVLGKTEKFKNLEEMEKKHAELFRTMMANRRVRPSLTLPLWDLGGYALGSISAVVHEEAAKACSEAVEDVVNDHYNSQLREFFSDGIEDEELLQGITKCRDDEVDTEFCGPQQESSYEVLREAVKSGCRLAIWVTERI